MRAWTKPKLVVEKLELSQAVAAGCDVYSGDNPKFPCNYVIETYKNNGQVVDSIVVNKSLLIDLADDNVNDNNNNLITQDDLEEKYVHSPAKRVTGPTGLLFTS